MKGASENNNHNDSYGYPWQLFVTLSLLIPVFAIIAFFNFESTGRWLSYFAFGLFSVAVITAKKHFKYSIDMSSLEFENSVFWKVLLSTISGIVCVSIFNTSTTNPAFNAEAGYPIKIVALIIIVAISMLGFCITNHNWTRVDFTDVLLAGTIVLFATSAMLVTRLGEILQREFVYSPFLIISVSGLIGLFFGVTLRRPNKSVAARPTQSLLIFSSLLFLVLLLSFRVDQIFNIAGAKFHWSYFTGAIDTLRSGGTLLWDTPSQYGIGPIFMPAILPINNSTTAFLIFQATLMFATVGFGLFVLKRITKNTRSFVILGLIWILVYFFADPALIGPQPYPSSSAVRFGPSLIFASFLLLALFSKLKETKPYIYKIGLPFIAAISFCWSAESLIYSLAIFGAYILGNILYGEEKNFLENIVKPILVVALGVITLLVIVCVVVFARVGHLPDFGMLFMYSSGYAQGFGSYPLEFASPVWLLVLVVSLLSVSWVVGTKTERNRTFIRMTIVLVGATGAWFSYFVGRAVPDNVIAMLPLIVFPLLVVTAFGSPLSATSELTVAGEKVSKSTYSWWLSIIAVLLTVSTLVLTNSLVKILTPGWLPAFQSSVKPLTWTDEALAPPALVEALNSIPAEYANLPIAYEGYHGVLLKTDGVLEWTPNTSQVWIPTPLGLLEEPISPAKQEQILSRFMASSPRDGLFIWDIKNSFPDRAERWKQLIQATHTCQQVYLSEDYEILQCAVTK